MVEYLIGNRLVEKGRLDVPKLEQVISRLNESRAKMGLLAVSEGMMTVEQAEEVNRFQVTIDKKFGDIAMERGYLTSVQVASLLRRQGSTYLAFAQELIDEGILTLADLDNVMSDYQEAMGFGIPDMEDIKSDDPERIVPLFMPPEAQQYGDVAGIMVKMILRCVDRHVYVGRASIESGLDVSESVFQRVTNVLPAVAASGELETGLSEVNGGLVSIANAFCKELVPLEHEDVLDASAEFLNCANALYATKLCREGTNADITPPITIPVKSHMEGKRALRMPIYVEGRQVDYIVMIK